MKSRKQNQRGTVLKIGSNSEHKHLTTKAPALEVSWEERFQATIKESRSYQRSLEIIYSCGLGTDVILSALKAYTEVGALEQVHEVQQLAKFQLTVLSKFRRRVCVFGAEMSLMPDEDRGLIPELPIGWPVELTCKLHRQLDNLQETADELWTLLRPNRSGKGAGRNDEVLVRLCLLVRAASDSPHWRDLSDLVEAAFIASGRDETWDKDKLRKVFLRFRKTHREDFEQLQHNAERSKHTLPATGAIAVRPPVNRRRAASKRQADWMGVSFGIQR